MGTLRPDEKLSSPRIMRAVPHGEDLYVRSVNGPTSAWYHGVQQCQQGHTRAGGVDKDVTLVDVRFPRDVRASGSVAALASLLLVRVVSGSQPE
jgi:Uncharacterized protein conserved in bacteria (DUF2255)